MKYNMGYSADMRMKSLKSKKREGDVHNVDNASCPHSRIIVGRQHRSPSLVTTSKLSHPIIQFNFILRRGGKRKMKENQYLTVMITHLVFYPMQTCW
jgi:hypothetical protein